MFLNPFSFVLFHLKQFISSCLAAAVLSEQTTPVVTWVFLIVLYLWLQIVFRLNSSVLSHYITGVCTSCVYVRAGMHTGRRSSCCLVAEGWFTSVSTDWNAVHTQHLQELSRGVSVLTDCISCLIYRLLPS